MAKVKIVLRKKPNKDGTFPLALRITKDRKTSYIYLKHNIKENEWNEAEQSVKSSHPNSKRLNNFILKKKHEASDKSIEAETQNDDISVKAIKRKVKPVTGATFVPQAQLFLDRLKNAGNFNVYAAEKCRLKIFKDFIGGHDIAFSDITVGLLEKFKRHLKSDRKISDRTIVNYLITIRAVFNQAIKEESLDKKYYPFGGEDKINIKLPESTKIGISLDDVVKLETVKLTNPTHDHARNLWLTSYYFAGMRISDVLRLRWSDFQNERLHYTMGKNNKVGSLKLPEKVQRILEKYEPLKTSPDDLVFPNLKGLDLKNTFEVKKKIAYAVNRCNKILQEYITPIAKIQGKLTTHVARHTFATLAGDKVPLQMLQKLYRHSDVRTTMGYQSTFIYKDADEALEAVIGS
ncbi:site-specific integrase [Spirosoma foliorum]|uniref:Phage integrase SAM-like domain-containing protein n=1 Tax=Spirosoma foliorum TaxID=2710596 RepID=A0A7G5H2X3_9BACT|nr:site-specific integrase [Spirosoma foliorum]QMW05465.1 phage integrase SAM-like domain-containing protein [Spirosoma foliorum]